MVGTTLIEIREHVESLASTDGSYIVHCSRTGDRPVPTAGKRFESRSVAELAAYAAAQYRAALRRYDPQLPHYDLVVSRDVGSYRPREQRTDEPDSNAPDVTSGSETESVTRPASPSLVEFCHQVAAAVFEALCDAGHRDVETKVMDVYFELAETVRDLDNLCLCLLESMAAELDQRLTPPEQADVFTDAATRLSPTSPVSDSVAAALETLEERGLVAGYACSPATVNLTEGTRSVEVRISDYALSPQSGRLPVLPLVLGVYRHEPAWPLSSLRAAGMSDGWKLTLVHSRGGDPSDLASVPIESGT